MRNLIAISLIGSLVVGLLASGCGGGGDDSTNTQQIDKATFARRANQICEQVSGRLAGELTSISTRDSEKPNYDFIKSQTGIVEVSLIPGFEEELQEINELGLPPDAKPEAQAMITAYRKSIKKMKANPKAIAEGATPFEVIEVAGTRIGASECPLAPVNST